MRFKFILFGILLSSQLFGQEFLLHVGYAIPSGNFSNSNIQKPDNGFAKPGMSYALHVNYQLVQHAGIAAEVGFSNQLFDTKTFSQQLESVNSFSQVQITSLSGYKSSYALLGLYTEFPKKKFIFNLHTCVGFVSQQTPSYKVSYIYSSNTGNDYIKANNLSSILFNWGLNVKYQLPKNFSVGVYLDNLIANLKAPVNNYSSSNNTTTEIKYQTYQMGLCLGYTF